MPLISQREYARQRGLSHEAIRRRVQRGAITLVDGRVDPERADAEWEQNKDILQIERGARSRGKARAEVVPTAAPAEPAKAQPAARSETPTPQRLGPTGDIRRQDIQTAREAVRLKKEKLLLEQIEGSVVDVPEMRQAINAMLAAFRSKCLVIADELSDKLASTTDPVRCRELVDAKIHAALSELSEWPAHA